VCGWGNSQYEENRKRQIAARTWRPFVDAQPVRVHLAALRAAGLGTRRIAELSGVSCGAIRGVLHGYGDNPPAAKVRRETAQAILSLDVTKAQPAARGLVDGTGTARRVQALCAIGWSLTAQAKRSGWEAGNYAKLAQGGPVRSATARTVARLYDRLSMTPAPASPSAEQVRKMAATRGWVPPLAWDDDEIDDPAAKPVGSLNRIPEESLEDFLARYQQVAGEALTWAEVAEKLGTTLDAVKSRVLRARRKGLPEAVAA
jgi:transcriptional regulator with XRE-family HTH domain